MNIENMDMLLEQTFNILSKNNLNVESEKKDDLLLKLRYEFFRNDVSDDLQYCLGQMKNT